MIGKAILSSNKMTIKKSLFGQTIVYKPTESAVKAYRQEYDLANGKLVGKILDAPAEVLEEAIKGTKIKKSDIGNMQLEACISNDRQFAAFRLFQFVDFEYKPISDLKVYEGDKASLIATIIG